MGSKGNQRRGDLSGTVSSSSGDGIYFDRLVRESGDFNPFTDRGWCTLSRRFTSIVRSSEQLRIVDVGCGTGQSRQVYLEQSSSYVGMDLSLEALALARLRFPGSSWVQADALRLPFSDDSFDVVAFSSVLHHVEDRAAALTAARRILRPGGWVFAFDPNLLHPAMLLFRYPRSPFYRAEGVSPDERPLKPSTLRHAFNQAGFSEIGQRCQSDIEYRAVAVKSLNALLPLYNSMDWLWERIGMGRWFGSFVVTWGRKL